MPISVRYALRAPKPGQTYTNPHPLEVWITVNGKRMHFTAVWPVQTGVRLDVNPDDWNVKQQRSMRRDDPVTRKLTAMKARIEQIFDRQLLLGEPTTRSVVDELTYQLEMVYTKTNGWRKPSNTSAGLGSIHEDSTLLEAYTAYLNDMRAKFGPKPTRAQHKKLTRWDRCLFLLKTWSQQKDLPVPPCHRITLSWLKEFHVWMVGQQSDKQSKSLSAPMASRYIGQIGKVLQWMVEDELIQHNAVKKKTWPRYDDKEINFLEPEHVARLFTLKWKGTKADALWWFLLMCCTGLDYPDAVLYAQQRSLYERKGLAGRKLVGKRLKPPHEDFDVPLLDEVDMLFYRYPKGARKLCDGVVNRYTDQIEGILGITWRITAKTARKTFGCLMLINGFYIGEVSRMLGHKRISTTEQHYAKIIGTQVDRGRIRVGKSSLL